MDNDHIREILESLMQERKNYVLRNVVSQEQLDNMINSYYQDLKSSAKKKSKSKLKSRLQ